jgi:hypothetical protein
MRGTNPAEKETACFFGLWGRRIGSRISRFLTGGAGEMTPEQKARVEQMEKDYEEWTRKKRGAAGSENSL